MHHRKLYTTPNVQRSTTGYKLCGLQGADMRRSGMKLLSDPTKFSTTHSQRWPKTPLWCCGWQDGEELKGHPRLTENRRRMCLEGLGFATVPMCSNR